MKVKKKTTKQLESEIDQALASRTPTAKERRAQAAQERRSFASSQDTAWRLQIIDQVRRWAEENGQGPWTPVVYNLVVKRLTKLTGFLRVFFPDAGEAPFDAHDAAALIVLPKHQALRLARKLFGGGPGITRDLHAEDLTFNMDWFRPKDFQ